MESVYTQGAVTVSWRFHARHKEEEPLILHILESGQSRQLTNQFNSLNWTQKKNIYRPIKKLSLYVEKI